VLLREWQRVIKSLMKKKIGDTGRAEGSAEVHKWEKWTGRTQFKPGWMALK